MKNERRLFIIILGLFLFVIGFVSAIDYDDFSGEELNLTLWDVEGDMDEYYLDVEEENFHTAQLNSSDRYVILTMLGYNFSEGDMVEYDLDYISGEGNRISYVNIDGSTWGFGLVGFWGEIQQGGNEYGIYHFRVEFIEGDVNIFITRPDNETIQIYDFPQITGTSHTFGVGTRTGDTGIVHMDYDNFKINEIEEELQCGDVIIENTILPNDFIDCPNDGIIIGADDITLDCGGHIIDGTQSGKGISLEDINNVTVKNCNVQEFSKGIYLSDGSIYNQISNNKFKWNNDGADISDFHNTFWNNNFTNNNVGVNSSGTYNTFWNNTFFENNNYGAYVVGTYNTFESNNFINNNYGAYLKSYYGNHNTFWDNNFINNNYGINSSSSHNTFWNNTFFENNDYGVYISRNNSHHNTFWDNNFTNNYINAYEGLNAYDNNWNTTIGNYWSDFELNYGFPNSYWIWGYGGGIDWHPILNEPPINVTEYIIDNSDPEFIVLSGDWNSRNLTNASNDESLFNNPGTGGERVGWQVNELVEPGTYEVYVWKFEHEYLSSMATNTHYQVYHRTGTSYWLPVNQQTPGNEWILLGEYEFDESRRLGILMNDDADGRVIADAVKLVYTGPLSSLDSEGPDLFR